MSQASVGFHCPDCVSARPQRVVNPLRQATGRPLVTLTLLVANVIVFLGELATGGSVNSGGGTVGARGALIALGRYRGDLVGVATGEWYRIFSSAFVHYGLIHLGMNMLALWVLGSQLEPLIGRLRFALVYVCATLSGSFAVLLVDPLVATAGASGAIYGLLGAVFFFQRSRGIDPWRSGIGAILIINLLFTLAVPGISLAGHVGGLIGGAIVGFVMFEWDKHHQSATAVVAGCVAFAAALFLAAVWAGNNWQSSPFL
jgi:membrane associated rhomboid family serine protease